MEVQGKIIAAMPERSGESARGPWKSQEFVIETQESAYPRKMVFTVFGEERLTRFGIQVGQNVRVSFDIDAHEWNGRWFNDIRAFDVRPVADAQMVPGAQPQYNAPQYNAPQAAPQAAPVQAPTAEGDSSEDLPF